MVFQWTLAAGFLYTEVFFLFLFCLPFIKPARWSKVFNSSIVKTIFSYGNFYFNVFIFINVIFFVDSIREIWKYQKIPGDIDMKNNPQAEIQYLMRLFRGQRNLYISGFALFLLFVLRRVANMLSSLATLEASNSASLQQAKSVSAHCQTVMEDNDKLKLEVANLKKKRGLGEKSNEKDEDTKEDKDEDSEGIDEVDKENELIQLRADLEKMTKQYDEKDGELKKLKSDFEALTKQAEGVNREYDRLLEEHGKAQKMLEKMTDMPEEEDNKKDN